VSCTKHQAALMELCQLLFSCFIFNKFGFGSGGGDVDCVDLAQDRNRWRAVVNVVMNLRFL
jgi:hypothetical protein